MARSKQKSKVGSHPRIQELDNLQEFKDYVGNANVPATPLIQKIEQLQAQRAEKLNERSFTQPALSTASTPKRYRKSGKETHATTTKNANSTDDLSPVGRFMFDSLDYTAYLIPIISVHVVLDILVRAQYSENSWESVAQNEILYRALMAIPVFSLLHFFVHPLTGMRAFRIASFFASVAVGGYLLYASNEEGYYYVMKRAPPLGTLWVWLFIEMEWQWSATSLVVIAFWMWLKDYSI